MKSLSRRLILKSLASSPLAFSGLALASGQAEEFNQKSWDYIIVGGGTAGCALANRLTEKSDARVLLVEAGGSDNRPEIQTLKEFRKVFATEAVQRYPSIPQADNDNRVYFIERGRVLGGSGSVNAMNHTRGDSSVYDLWDAFYGAKGWRYQDVLKYFKNTETWADGENEFRGGNGPVYVDSPNKGDANELGNGFMQAAQNLGYSFNPDCNDGQTEGIAWNQLAIKDGLRQSGGQTYLKLALADNQRNLDVLTHTRATRLIIENHKVTGIEAVNNEQTYRFNCNVEVLVCAGALESPKLLMLSGIGAEPELRAVGLQAQVALPAVGKNLQEHLMGQANIYRTEAPLHPGKFMGVDAWAVIRTQSDLPVPDLGILAMAAPFQAPSLGPITAPGFALLPCLNQPKSRGTLTLRSANPMDWPIIDPGFFSEPSDLEFFKTGYEISRELGHSSDLTDLWQEEVHPGKKWDNTESQKAFIQNSVNTYGHACGTCRMGNDPEESVVDNELKVFGVEGLRVADASVIPLIPNAPTNAAVFMIAEKAAELIKSA